MCNRKIKPLSTTGGSQYHLWTLTCQNNTQKCNFKPPPLQISKKFGEYVHPEDLRKNG